MSKADYATFKKTGNLPATSETFISPTKSFAQGYDGVTAQITLKPGTTKVLQSVGVRDGSALTQAAHSEMPMVSKGWKSNNAFFKGEGEQINIGLGNGTALDIFNSGIQSVKKLMNDNEKKMVMGLVLKSITKEEFLKEYPVDVQQDKQYVTKVLKDALVRKDPDDVEYALLLGFSFEFEEDVVPVLCELIVQDWHFKHEDMARLLQEFKRPDSVECLYNTALMELDYLDYDDSYTLAVKCIWALGDINTDSSRDKLRQLALSENQVVKEAAEYQLNRTISP